MAQVPLFGSIFIPVALWVFFARPRYLLALIVFSSIFDAASVLNVSFGTFLVGVQPFFFVAFLVAIRSVISLAFIRACWRRLNLKCKEALATLFRFWAWSMVGAFVFPFVFKGVGVVDPRASFSLPFASDVSLAYALYGQLTPLAWSFRNLGQALYLTLDVTLMVYAATVAIAEGSVWVIKTLRHTILIAALFVIGQILAARANVGFPYAFFNNNPAYMQGYNEMVAGIKRGSATFTEPSYAGGFLAAGALGLIATALYGARRRLLTALVTTLGCVLTTASTGFATLVMGGGLLLAWYSRIGNTKVKVRVRRVTFRKFVSLFLAIGTLAAIMVAASPLKRAVVEVTTGKFDTLSMLGRLEVFLYSAGLTLHTYGLGLGLGSNRSYDLSTELLSDVGVIGAILFASFFYKLLSLLFKEVQNSAGSHLAMVAWILVGLLTAQIIAIPDLSWPPLWAVSAVSVALLVSIHVRKARETENLGSRIVTGAHEGRGTEQKYGM